MNIDFFLKAHKESVSLSYQRGCYRSSLNTFVMGNAIS